MAKINEQSIVLEDFLREKVRDIIAEEMISLTEWDPREWDEDPSSFGPEHGERRHDPQEGEVMWSQPHKKWLDAHSWRSEHTPDPTGETDPEHQMHPEDKKKMMDALLSMEFDENKQIHMEYLTRMIREHVRKYLKASK